MAQSKIPEEIKQYRPGPCTEVKLINGHYYVYMYEALHLPSGKWGKKTGKCIGTIIEGKGFIPNKNYHLYKNAEPDDDITVLEYGQYALIEETAKDIRAALEKFFPVDRAAQIFAYACILYANGFVHLDQIQGYYEQSWLSQECRDFTFGMGKNELSTLLDDLGRRTTRVINYENAAIAASSSAIAIVGHAIRSRSDENDPDETGYKFDCPGEDQVNLIMGYDINTGTPLFARMYRGACTDEDAMEDIDDLLTFSGILFVLDRDFYGAKNLKPLSDHDNSYIIPVPANTTVFRNEVKNVRYTDSFYYRAGKKHARIEYACKRLNDTENIYVFRDVEENEKCRFNYQHSIELGNTGYSADKLEKIKETFGVYVLQSNASLSPEEVFGACKERSRIDTFCQYLKNNGDFNDLMTQDYYREQGFSFIMLITGQIHQKMLAAVRSLDDNTVSVQDVLLMARCMKMERRGSNWNLKNTRKRDMQIMERLGFVPQVSVTVSE